VGIGVREAFLPQVGVGIGVREAFLPQVGVGIGVREAFLPQVGVGIGVEEILDIEAEAEREPMARKAEATARANDFIYIQGSPRAEERGRVRQAFSCGENNLEQQVPENYNYCVILRWATDVITMVT
jgi:hypothetical protein